MEFETKYQGFFWGNFYLSSIQQGIQTAHVVGKMGENPNDVNAWKQWAYEDFTINVRNGGDHKALDEFSIFLHDYGSNYTWNYFHESHDALKNAVTCVGIILPNYVYAPEFEPAYHDNSFEADIYRKIKSTGLAR